MEGEGSSRELLEKVGRGRVVKKKRGELGTTEKS